MVNRSSTKVPRIREQGQSFQQTVLRKLDIYTQWNELGPLSNATHKNQLKADERLNHET